MAWYTVTYACGHTDRIQLYGKTKDRESRIKWLETVDCPECHKKQQTEEADKYATENELPDFTSGSEKQIDWAKKIRCDFIKDHWERHGLDTVHSWKNSVVRRVSDLIKKTHPNIDRKEAGELYAKAVTGDMEKTKENYESAILARFWDKALSKTDARWWIDHRFDLSSDFIDAVTLDIYNEMFVEEAEQKKNETVTVKAKSWGKCKNGSYWLKTKGVNESTDLNVNTQLAFVTEATENEDGTLTINAMKAEEALENARMRTGESCTIRLTGNPEFCLIC